MNSASADLLGTIREYVEIESPSGAEDRLNTIAERIAADLAASGAAVEPIAVPGTGRHVVARWSGDDRPPLLLLGHFDTVHPVGTLERLPFRAEDARAYGPGIFDMKASIAAFAAAMHGATHARPVVAVFTCDEEVGSSSSRPLIERIARDCAAVLVPEPPLPGGAAKTRRKGVGMYVIEAHGRAAHAGIEPECGVDAVAEISRVVQALGELARPELGTTVVVGRIEGGSAGNVVAAHARAELDVRYATAEEGARVHAALHALRPRDQRVRLEVTGGENRPPLVRTPGIERLYRHARDCAAAIGFELGEGATGGGSDGSYTAALGVPTLDGIGIPGAGAHTLEEHILLDELPLRVAFYRRLVETL